LVRALPERPISIRTRSRLITAQIALMLAFVYAWPGVAPAARRAAAALVLVLAGIMGLSQTVSFKHWLTDTIGSVFLCWLALHWSYYYLPWLGLSFEFDGMMSAAGEAAGRVYIGLTAGW
jgi:hypothetical protein